MAPKMVQHMMALFLAFNLCTWIAAELFTAMVEIEPLLEMQKRIVDDLDGYIAKEEQRLFTLKNKLEYYKREHDKAMEDIPNYLGNPINAFTLIKRLSTDLDDIEHSIHLGVEYVKNISIRHESVKYPTHEDLVGAVQALARLQDTYQLEVKDLSTGILNGVVYNSPLSAADCFEIGRGLYNQKEYRYCIAWMMEALGKYREESDIYPFYEVEIMECIGFSHYKLGDVKSALKWTRKLLKLEPNHSRARDNVTLYEKELAEKELKFRETDVNDQYEALQQALNQYSSENDIYKSLCRGEVDIPIEISRRLKCWYLTENHPFLRLAPFKVEQMYIEPNILIFHQVISNEEIDVVKENARPRFKRAEVFDAAKNNERTVDRSRISKSAWLYDHESPVIARITQRVADMTGLSMDLAEELQVVNYGIGGHYEAHCDFVRESEKVFGVNRGNRIATVMFYMSDVAQGGATVFTQLGLSVFPQKHAALYWMNLRPSGDGDYMTRHAACPVLTGSKWVCNKWIHQGGQEFIKPCNRKYKY